MPHGLFITLTHTGIVRSSLLLSDVYPTTDGHTAYRRAGPAYVPINGTITLTYTDTVATSFENGTIRGFVDLGYLTATLSFGTGVGPPVGPAGGDLDGLYPNPTVVGIQGIPIQNAGGPVNGDALLYNSLTQQWEHSPIVFGGGPPVGPAGGDLGGLYPNPTVDGLQGNPVDNAAPAASDVLAWDGAQWTPTSIDALPITAVYGQFSDSTDQPLVANTPFVVKYNTTDAAHNVSVLNDPITLRPTRITVAASGIYEFTLSLQVLHTGGGGTTITFWARLDGTNIPGSASSIEMGNNNNRTLPFVPLILPLTAGQHIEWVVLSTGTNTSVEAYSAIIGPPDVPAIPSVIAGVKRLGA